MFIVVYHVFHYIVYCVYFEERSKMGLSCPHFILFPKGGSVKLRSVLVRCGRDVCMLWIYFSHLIKLTVVFLVVCVTFSCRFSRQSCL